MIHAKESRLSINDGRSYTKVYRASMKAAGKNVGATSFATAPKVSRNGHLGNKINYLIWAGLRHSVPKHLKNSNCPRSEISLILTIDNKEFDILEKKSKDYYMLIKRIIAQCPKNSKHLCQDFNLTHSLRASSPIWAAPRSRVLARLSSLAQIGELARRLSNARPAEKSIPSST